MRLFFGFVMAGSILLLSSCADKPQVTADYDHGVNFSRYHTYDFAAKEEKYQTLTDEYIRLSVAQEMQRRGYTLSASPDLLIYWHTSTQNKVQMDDEPSLIGRVGYAGWAGYNQSLWTYTEGMLTVDLVDRNKRQLVWRATASHALDVDKPVSQENIGQTVAALFSAYPAPGAE